MGTPITWRNVSSDNNPAAISSVFDAATRNLTGGLGALGGILDKSQTVQDNNVKALDEAAKNAYLDQLAGAKTPEALAALQASGQLDAARLGLSAASRGAVRGADEARTTTLRTNDTAAFDFNTKLRERVELPQIQAINADIAIGTPESLARAKASTDSANIQDKTALYTAGHAQTRARLGEAHADTLYGQSQETYQHGLTMRPLADAAAVRTDKLGKIALEDAQYNNETNVRQRGQEKVVQDFSANHQLSTQAMRESVDTGLVDFAGSKLLPRHSDGSLAIEQMDSATLSKVNGHLAQKGLPSLDAVLGNDTAARGKLLNVLRASGATPGDLAKIDSSVTAGVSTNTPAPIGQEAEFQARQLRSLQVEEQQVNGQFGTVTNQGDKGALLKSGVETLKGLAISPTGGGLERYTRGLSTWLDKGGIPVGNTGERVLPSEQQLALILSQVRTGFLYNAQSDVTDLLDTWAKSPEAQEGALKVIQIRNRNRLLGIDPLIPAGAPAAAAPKK